MRIQLFVWGQELETPLSLDSRAFAGWRNGCYIHNTMKLSGKTLLLSLTSIGAAAALSSCNVEKTEDGEMPEVKVEGEAKLPEYDVDAPSVDVGTETKTIEVPTVDIIPADEDTDDE